MQIDRKSKEELERVHKKELSKFQELSKELSIWIV